MAMRTRYERKLYVRMRLHFRLHSERIELCAVGGDDEVVYAGFVAPVVGLGRVFGVEVPGRAFVERPVDGEGALVFFEVRVAHDYHFVQVVRARSPVDAVVVWAVADVLPVFAVGFVGDEGAAV